MRHLFETYRVHYRALVSLGVPIVLGQVGNIVLGFADTLMVGHHSMQELAAASLVNTVFMLFVIFAMGFSYGLTPIVGNLFGRGETGAIGGKLRNAVAANLMLSAILVAVLLLLYFNLHRLGQPEELLPLIRPYLLVNIVSLPFLCCLNAFKQFYDAIGHTRTPMYVLLGGNLMNILGNWLLIYGVGPMPEMGLFGAGVSTFISRVAMMAAFVWLFFGLRRYGEYRRGLVRSEVNKADFGKVNALGWPLALQMGMETAAFSLTAIFVGWIGTTALAAHQVMITVSQLFYMVYYGFAAAVAVRVSYFSGQRDIESVRRVTMAGFHIILFVAFVVSVPIFFLRGTISLWFTDSREVCLLVSQTVIPLIVYQFGDGLQCAFANALRGLQCVKPMMRVAFFSYFVVSLPLSWGLGIGMGYGLEGIWWAFPVCLTTAGVLYCAVFRKATRATVAG